MAIVIGGHETGLLDGSLAILDRGDRTGATDPGAGEQIYVNVASGNLTVQNRDVFMPSLGDDYELIRTYNSRPVPAYEVRLSDNPWARTYNVFIMDKTINGQKCYEVTYADGSTLLFRWDATINAFKSIDGDGTFERMVELTQSGTEWTPFYEVTRADQSRMIFSKHGRLLEWVDTNGVRTEFSYNAQLHLSRVRDDQGHIVDYNYTNNRVTSVVHNVYGTLVQYTYNSSGRLASVTDRNGHITRYFYNTDGYLSRIELPDRQTVNGQLQTFTARVYQFEYKAPPIDWTGSGSKQLLTRIIGPDGTYTTIDYTHDVGNNGTQPDPNKRPEDQWFRGGSTKVVDALGNARARSNDAQYVQWRLANGYYQTYTASREIPANPWDPIPDPAFKAQVDAIRNAHSMVYEFDADSYITSVTDQQGFKTQYVYDAQNNVKDVIDGNGWGAARSDSTYFRKLRADLGYVDSAGNGKLVANLSAAEVTALTEAFTTHYEYDTRGNRTKQTDNADNVTTWTYTSFNKVASTTSAVGHALTTSNSQYYQDKRVALGYSALVAGLSDTQKNALRELHTTTYTYDSRQNLTERRDPGGDLTRFEYDSFGNNTRRIVYLDSTNLVDPDKQQITQYKYDAFGNVVQVIDAEGKKTENQYDPFGNLTRSIDAKGAATLYTYDNDNRLISTTTAQGNTTVFAYDAVGNRIGVTDAAGHTITSMFDLHNNLLTTLDPSLAGAAQNRQTQHTYDVVGNHTSTTDAEGRRTDYEFNTRRELVKTITATVAGADGVTPVRYQSTTSYDGVGNRVTTTDNRGFTTEYLFTQNHLIRQQTDAIGHITRYTYDANNNQVQIVAGLQLETAKRQILKFTFDEENQVISQVDAMAGVSSQSYDAVGNRLSFTDANGNTTNFIFDKNNRRRFEIHPQVADPVNGGVVRYAAETRYDGNGNVIEEIDENGHSTKYTFDRDNRLVVTQDAKGTKTIFQYDSRNNRTSVTIDGDATVQPVSVNESFSEQISYENFENGWGGYLPGGEDAIIYSGNVYAFEGNNAANIRDNSGSVSSFVSAPNGLVPAPSPVPSATYSATSVGTAGCTGAANCSLESWGVDLNEGTGFRWNVAGGTGGQAQLYVKVAAATSTRSMSLWVNNVRIGTITANPNEAPRPVGKEFGPLVVQLSAGNNTVELRDTEGQGEFDVHSVRTVGLPVSAPPPNDIPNATYSAASVGTAGCTGTAACTLQSWGIDLNEGAGFRWNVAGGPGSGGQAQLYLKVASASGNRSMSLWVNNVRVGTVTANSTQAPRPTGFEYGPFLVNLTGGNNTVEVRDTEGSTELDVHSVRVVAVPNQSPPPGQTGQGSAAPGYDFTRYSQVNLNFAFYTEHLTAGESFFVEYSSDGGTQWSTVKRYINGTDFNNFLFVEKALTLNSSQYNFSNNVKFRFRSDTQDDARNIFVDHIKLNGTGTRTRTYENITVAAPKNESVIQTYTYNEFNELVGYTDGMGNALLESNLTLYQDERQRLGFARNTTSLTAANRTAIKALYTATTSYDRVGNIKQTKDNEGRITSFTYDALDRQVQITDAKNGITKSRYDGNGNRVALVDANNRTTQFTFDAVNRLTDTIDALNTTDHNTYDDFDNLLEVAQAYGSTDVRTTRYEYDLNNRLRRRTRPELDFERYNYDAVGNRIEVFDGRGSRTEYKYDAMNRNIKIIDPLTFETRYEYDGVGNRLTIIDARGGITRMEYDPVNLMLSLTDAEQRKTTYSYDLRGNKIVQRTGVAIPAGTPGQLEVTEFLYDAENNLRSVKNAEGKVTTSSFDRVYNIVKTVDANGGVTTTQFDALNRKLKITDALLGVTEFSYDAVGNKLTQTDALLNKTVYRYDAINRLIEQEDAYGIITRYADDRVSNQRRIDYAYGTADASFVTFTYDLNDRLKFQTDAEGNTTEYFYDNNDNVIEVKDPRGNSTHYQYDQNNRVKFVTDPEDYVVEYRYDANGNRVKIIDARGKEITNYYNANNEIKVRVDAEGYATAYVYDANGNLHSETLHMQALSLPLDPAQVPVLPTTLKDQKIQYEYDLLNRIKARVDGEGYRTEYTYDAVGNRIAERQFRNLSGSDDAIQRSFYDALNREVAKVTAEGYLTRKTYDAVGNLRFETVYDNRIVVPGNGSVPQPLAGDTGRTKEYIYNNIYRLKRETSALQIHTDYEYDQRGNRTAVIKAAQTDKAQRTDYEYDLANRLVETVDAKGTRTFRELDENGNVTKLYEAYGTPDERSTSYDYDGNNRQIIKTDAKGTVTRTHYDGNGNVELIERAVGLPEYRTEKFEYNNNNKQTVVENGEGERTVVAYDGAGNQRSVSVGTDINNPERNSARTTLFDFDKDNRLILEENAEGVFTKYEYDGADNNIKKYEAYGIASEQRLHTMGYDRDNRLISRTDPMGHSTTFTLDVLGNTVEITDARGNKVTNTFDKIGRLEVSRSQEGVVTKNTYDLRNNIATTSTYLIDSLGTITDKRTTTFHYDVLDRLVQEDNGEDFSTVSTYDVFGNKLTEISGLYLVPMLDQNGNLNANYDAEKAALAAVTRSATYKYDVLDRLDNSIDGAGRKKSYEYDALGNKLAETDDVIGSGSNRKTTFEYDKADRVKVVHTPELGEKRNFYNVHGELIRTEELQGVDEDDNETWIINEFGYDSMGRLAFAEDGENNRIEYGYDAVGNQDFVHYGVGSYAAYTNEKKYDLNNRVMTEIDGQLLQVNYFYDAVGNLTKKTDARGNSEYFYYDRDNREIAKVNAEKYLERTQYDSLNHVLVRDLFATPVGSVTEANIPSVAPSPLDRRNTYAYDSNGIMIREENGIWFRNASAVGEVTLYELDNRGNIVIQTDNMGRQTKYTYDSESRVKTVETPDGVITEFEYDRVGNNTLIRYAVNTDDESVRTFSYDYANRIVSQKDYLDLNLQGSNYLEVTYSYDRVGNKVGQTDGNDHKSTWIFDKNNKEIAAKNPLGHSIDTTYDAIGNVVQIKDANGNYTTNYFSKNNQLILSVDGEGWAKTFTYDNNGNLTTERLHMTARVTGVPETDTAPVPVVSDEFDQVITYEYDAINRKKVQIDAEGYRSEFTLDAFGNQTKARYLVDKAEDAPDGQARWAEVNQWFDALGRATHVVSAERYLTYYVYDEVGNLAEKNLYKDRITIPANGNPPTGSSAGELKYQYSYDDNNRLAMEISPAQVKTKYAYDARGNQTSIAKAWDTGQASTTEFTFDKANRLTDSKYPNGAITHLVLDGNGNIKEEHLASNSTADIRKTIFEYDENNRVKYKTLAAGTDVAVTTYFERDANGNIRFQHEANATLDERVVEFLYDKNNRAVAEVRSVENPNVSDAFREERSEIFYDGAGNRVRKVVAAGTDNQRITLYQYDLDNRLSVEVAGVDEDSATGTFSGGTRTEYKYDGMGNKLETKQAVGTLIERTSHYKYDLEGRIVEIKDPMGGETGYEYDVHGNQSRIVDANGNERVNTYDNMGHLKTSLFDGVLVVNNYDFRGNLIDVTQSDADGGDARTTRYKYDRLDQQIEIIDPEGFSTIMQYDLVGNQTLVTSGLYQLAPGQPGYDATKAQQAEASASSIRFDFDKLNRQIRMTSADGSDYESVREFIYDAVGNKISEKEAVGSGRQNVVVHKYDKANRLIRTQDPEGGVTEFRYNEAGEKVLQRMLQQDGSDEVDTSGPIWITHVFGYDSYGRMSSKHENPEATNPAENIRTEYGYDALGNQELMTVGAGRAADEQRISVKKYDLNNRVVEEIDAEENSTYYKYDALGNRIEVEDAAGNIARYYFDARGNSTRILDANGYISRFKYDSANNRTEERVYATRFTGVVPENGQPSVAASDDDRVSTSSYNRNSKVILRTEADGAEHIFDYDSVGNLIAEERFANTGDPLTTAYEYDLLGRLTSFTDTDGSVTKTFYDASSNKSMEIVTEPSGFKDENGDAITRTLVTLYQYDLNNRLVEEIFDPRSYVVDDATVSNPTGLNIVQKITYDEMGNAISKTHGYRTEGTAEFVALTSETFTYDLVNRLFEQKDGLENVTRFTYDHFGDQRAVLNPRGTAATSAAEAVLHEATFEYDRMGRALREIQPEVTMFSLKPGVGKFTASPIIQHQYDSVGNEVRTIDGNGFVTTRYYDANRNLVAEVNGDGVYKEWSYNAFGEVASETIYTSLIADPGAVDVNTKPVPSEAGYTADFEYDKAGRPVKTTYPPVDFYSVEGLDDVTPTIVSPPTSEASRRLTEVKVYDEYGNLAESYDRAGNLTLAYYDAKGQLIVQIDGAGYASMFDYDGQGNAVRQYLFMEPITGWLATESTRPELEDVLSHLDQIVEANTEDDQIVANIQVVTRIYDNAGRLIEERSPAIDVFDTSGLSPAQLRSLSNANTQTKEVVTRYTYDAVGNQLTKTMAAGSGQAATEYSYYDAANRRIALIDGSLGLSVFYYDENGNRTKLVRFYDKVADTQDPLLLYGNSDFTTQEEFAELVEEDTKDTILETTFNGLNQEVTRTERMDRADITDDLTESFYYDGMNQKTWSQQSIKASENTDTFADKAFVTKYDYDARGNVVQIENADGSVKLSTYDAAGNLVLAFTGAAGAPAEAEFSSVEVGEDGLLFKWEKPVGVQSYLVYGTSSIGEVDESSIQPNSLTKLGYSSSSGLLGNQASSEASALLNDAAFAGGDTIYFRVVTKNASGGLAWSKESSVIVPPKLSGVSVQQVGTNDFKVIVTFDDNVDDPQLDLGALGTRNLNHVSGTQYEVTLNNLSSPQDVGFEITWQDSLDQSFTTEKPGQSAASFSLESREPHQAVSTSLKEQTVTANSVTKYKVNGVTLLGGDTDIRAVTVSWSLDNPPTDGEVEGSVAGTAIEKNGNLEFKYQIGANQLLDEGTYTVTLRGVVGDAEVYLDQFKITLDAGATLDAIENSLSIALPPDGGSQQAFIDGERVSSTRRGSGDDRRLTISLDDVDRDVEHDYTVLYGSFTGSNHTTTAEVENGDDLTVNISFSENDYEALNQPIKLAYKLAGSEGPYADIADLVGDDAEFTHSVTRQNFGSGIYDFKAYYSSGGNEVVVELFRFDMADPAGAASFTGRSITVSSAEYDGSLMFEESSTPAIDKINFSAGLYIGRFSTVTGSKVTGLEFSETSSSTAGALDDLDGTSSGYFTVNKYDVLGRRIGTNEQTGNWQEFLLDKNGNAVVTNDYGQAEFVGEGEVSFDSANPIQTFKVFDARNRVIGEYMPLVTYDYENGDLDVTGTTRGSSKSFGYDALDRVVTESVATGDSVIPEIVVTREYDLAGNLIAEIKGDQSSDDHTAKYWRYDSLGNETAFIDGLDNITIKQYDKLNKLSFERDGEGHIRAFGNDHFGRMTSEVVYKDGETNALYEAAYYKYDHRNRVVEQGVGDKRTATYGYDGRNNRISTLDGKNNSFTQTWDEMGQALTEKSYVNAAENQEAVTRKEYDAFGNVVAEYDEMNRVTQKVYGAFGQLKMSIDQGGRETEYRYDRWGRMHEEIGEASHIKRSYDSLGRLLEVKDLFDGDANDYAYTTSTVYTYDLAGNRKSENVYTSDGQHQREMTYTYDARGQLASWLEAVEGVHMTYAWDKAGNLLLAQSAAGWDPTKANNEAESSEFRYINHEYIYYKNNLVREIRNADDTSKKYKVHEYDAAGLRTYAAYVVSEENKSQYAGYSDDKFVAHEYFYNADGTLDRAEWQSGDKDYEAVWTYDEAGNVTKYLVNNETDNKKIQEDKTFYTDNYRVRRTENTSLNDDGEESTQVTDKKLDLSGRVLESTSGEGDNTYVYDYEYSSDGREQKVTAHGKASGTSTSTYDHNDQLVGVHKGQGDGADGPEILRFVNNSDGQILYRFHDQGKNDETDTKTEYFYANGNAVGEKGNDNDGKTSATLDTARYSLVKDIGGDLPTPSISSYTVRAGDSLQGIAASLFGNGSLWFVLAEANGLDASASLKVGTRLTVPNSVETGRLTADAHALYSQGDIVGSTLPNLKSPPPKKSNGCIQILVIVLVVIVAVVAAVFTAGIGGAIVGALGGGLLATLGALAVAGLVGAAIGLAANALTQGIYIAFGMQKDFNWGSFWIAGAAGFLSGVAGGLGAAAQAAAKAGETLTYAKIAIPALRVGAAALNQMGSDADGDGKPDMKITSWVGLAAAGVGGALEGFSYDASAADVASNLGKAPVDAALSSGTIDTIQKVVEYATPWAQLAESYLTRDPDQDFDWLSTIGSAVASNLISAVDGPLQKNLGTDNSFSDRLTKAFVNTSINALTAGVMAGFDQDRAMAFLTSSVGNEVGQLVGGVLTIDTTLKRRLDDFSDRQLEKLTAEYRGAEEASATSTELQQAVRNGYKAQSQQEAATSEESQSEPVAEQVATSEPPQEGTESTAPEPQVPTILNRDGKYVPVGSAVVDSATGKMTPWDFAKQLADARAQSLGRLSATDMEISRQYRLLVELNGDKINFRRPLENGTTLQTVNFDDNVAVSPRVNSFVNGQAQDDAERKAARAAAKKAVVVQIEEVVIEAPAAVDNPADQVSVSGEFDSFNKGVDAVFEKAQEQLEKDKLLLGNASVGEAALMGVGKLWVERWESVKEFGSDVADAAVAVKDEAVEIAGEVSRGDMEALNARAEAVKEGVVEVGEYVADIPEKVERGVEMAGNVIDAVSDENVRANFVQNLDKLAANMDDQTLAYHAAPIVWQALETAATAGLGGVVAGAKVAKTADTAVDVVDTALDTAKLVDKVTDAGKVLDNVADTRRKVDKVVDASRAVDRAVDAGQVIDEVADTSRNVDRLTDAAGVARKAPAKVTDDIVAEANKLEGVTVKRLACFVAGTLVETADGLKAIEQISLSDKVLSRNEYTGHVTYKPVVDLKVSPNHTIYRLGVLGANGVKEEFRTTDNHPFWVEGTGWVRAADLAINEKLTTPEGQTVQVISLQQEAETATVYNFEVADYHTYFVGELKVLVHNDDCGRLEISAKQGNNDARWIVDRNGEPLEVSGVLREDFGGKAKGNVRSTQELAEQAAAGKKGLPDDDGGHLIAHRFFKDQGVKNLFPQNKNFNRSAFKKLENDYAEALTVPGTEIKFHHSFGNIDTNGRPTTVSVYTEIWRNGKLAQTPVWDTFENKAGQVYEKVIGK